MPIEEVGIYLSTSSILSTALPGDAANFADQKHQYAVWGWGTALSQLHYQYRIVPEWNLNPNLLQALKILIIPNAEAFEPADVATLQTWVTSGGCLIVTGDSGSLLGESGNFASTNKLVLAPLTGVTNFSGAPALWTNFLGAGAVFYYSNNEGYVYYNATSSGRAALLAGFWNGPYQCVCLSPGPTGAGLLQRAGNCGVDPVSGSCGAQDVRGLEQPQRRCQPLLIPSRTRRRWR